MKFTFDINATLAKHKTFEIEADSLEEAENEAERIRQDLCSDDTDSDEWEHDYCTEFVIDNDNCVRQVLVLKESDGMTDCGENPQQNFVM